MKNFVELNTILYGPPGTGKTFNTTLYAVGICNNETIVKIEKKKEEIDADFSKYEEIKKQYNELKQQGRIEFVTFHQSYGYEEFIEGIKPKVDESDSSNVEYEIRDGIFKEFCNRAKELDETIPEDKEKELEDIKNKIPENPKIWKLTIKNNLDDCYSKDRICIHINLKPTFRNIFKNDIKKDDIIVISKSTTDIIGVAKVTGDSYTENVWFYRPVEWLLKNIDEKTDKLKNRQFWTSTIQELTKVKKDKLVSFIEDSYINNYSTDNEKENYVFIIDEINRGNISKIFGELITLIEENKRDGASEGMSTTLPYSGGKFSVPDNVYILGTMNTADRSIALLDTALRRRFNFIEMMPQPELLKDIKIKDNNDNETNIDLVQLLTKINERIEALLDRDHTLGHSYFWDLKKSKNQTVGNLKKIFENSVIPLLQEYFYEDFEKIQLVLDNKIIKIEDFDKGLFKGNSDIIEGKKLYKIDTDALNKIDSYIEIYESKTKKTEDSNTPNSDENS